ncbi:cytochrome P450 [Phanerochaete sordida]|uniref:Cytochrome P450 n=1 Tax=Phanerochaete sordida TaxID=48140 RepID=A0A9P3G3R4_9APHY|nr:cytochrome P450 [Phanerochaete sordida]
MEASVFNSLAAVVIALLVYYSRKTRRRYPPGPRGLPFVGNVLDVPRDGPGWLTYARWSREYESDVIYMSLLGTPVIVLNSIKAATELFEKRSSIYSDRQRTVMMHEYVKGDRSFSFLGYGDEWREHRRLFHQYFSGSAIENYHPKILKEARKVLTRLHTSDDFMKTFRVMAAAVVLGVTFGMEIEDTTDPYVVIAEEAINTILQAAVPGAFMVDYVPISELIAVKQTGRLTNSRIVRYIPSWAPGGGFKRTGTEWHKLMSTMIAEPFRFVKEGLAAGAAKPSIAAALLEKLDESDVNAMREYEVAQQVTSTAYLGAADTTVSALGTFVLCMVMNPSVQAIAQGEIDRIVGNDSLPDFTYRDELPYISAIMYEVLRFQPVAPLGVPHRLMVDDEYAGYHLPAGAMVVGNIWAIMHDPERFPNPEAFDPTRWLTPDGQLSETADAMAAFGFGRRICPGRYFAMESMWMTIAHILSVYSIEKPVDDFGNTVEPSGKYVPGFLTYPEPFKTVFKPRSSAALSLVRPMLGD